MFHHCKPDGLVELNTISIEGKRHYITPNGNFPSITTVLSSIPNPSLDAWRKRVGEAEANKISKIASSRGTDIHSLIESYLNNEQIDKDSYFPADYLTFKGMLPILNNINNIYGLEIPLYSTVLQVAGRCDCIAEYDNVLSIVDFKTSKKEKRKEYIESYFLQATFYCMAFYELTGIEIKQIAILIAVDNGENQVFVEKVKNYVPKLVKVIKNYRGFTV